mgnify:CR=1 FL=1
MKEELIEELKKFPLLQELSDEDMKVFAGRELQRGKAHH